MPNPDRISNEEKYRILVNERNFLYENFSKWVTYFYVAVGALFIGYVELEDSRDVPLKLIVSVLGYLVSLFLYWTSKGYYYWYYNYIILVEYYERDVLKWKKKERIFSAVANKEKFNRPGLVVSGARISTSKVALLFSFIIACSWFTILSYRYCLSIIPQSCSFLGLILCFVLGVFLNWGLTVTIAARFLESKVDSLHDLKLN